MNCKLDRRIIHRFDIIDSRGDGPHIEFDHPFIGDVHFKIVKTKEGYFLDVDVNGVEYL